MRTKSTVICNVENRKARNAERHGLISTASTTDHALYLHGTVEVCFNCVKTRKAIEPSFDRNTSRMSKAVEYTLTITNMRPYSNANSEPLAAAPKLGRMYPATSHDSALHPGRRAAPATWKGLTISHDVEVNDFLKFSRLALLQQNGSTVRLFRIRGLVLGPNQHGDSLTHIFIVLIFGFWCSRPPRLGVSLVLSGLDDLGLRSGETGVLSVGFALTLFSLIRPGGCIKGKSDASSSDIVLTFCSTSLSDNCVG